jgi:hypothetical protein
MTQEEFGTSKQEQKPFTQKKTLFLNLNTNATIRILSKGYTVVDTHYINKATVKCLGDECPICATNKSIIMQNPDGFRDDPRYIPKRKVYMVNVFDKTLVKVCPSCGAENPATASNCSKCSAIIAGVTPEPSNKVKVLSRGVTLFDHLGAVNNAILDSAGEKIGITNYDIMLMVSGSGKDKTITPIPGAPSPAPEYSEADLVDLNKVTIELTAVELLDLQRGVSLRDIFAARKAGNAAAEFEKTIINDDKILQAQLTADELFGSPS